MLKDYIRLTDLDSVHNEIYNCTRSGLPTAVFSATQGDKYHIASLLDFPVLYLVKDSVYARKACIEIGAISEKKTVFLPAKDDVLLYRKAYNKSNLYQRITALYQVFRYECNVVTTPDALMQLFPKKIKYIDFIKGNEYNFENVINNLIELGYERTETIEDKAQFSIRGDIIEIAIINDDNVYRLDFFGDVLERIRIKETSTEFGDDVDDITVVMAYDFFISPNEVNDLEDKILSSVKQTDNFLARNKSKQLAEQLISTIESGSLSDNLTFLMPILSSSTNSVFSFINENYVIIYDEAKMIFETANNVLKEHNERFNSLFRVGEVLSFSKNQYSRIEDVVKQFQPLKKLALQNITNKIEFFEPTRTIRLKSTPITRYTVKQDELYSDIKNWSFSSYRVIICCGSNRRAELLYDALNNNGIFSEYNNHFDADFKGVKITSYYLGNGFICHERKLVVIGTGDLYLSSEPEKKIKKRRNDLFDAPVVGDFAVHETYGIGIIRGTKKISTQDGTKDYVEVEYRDGDRLYIPVEDMDKLTKYLGGSESPQLSKIGGGEFEKIKQRVRESISQMKINLKRLYAERRESKGFVFSEDNEMTEAFDEAFEFEPTEDQIQSIQEIKTDMESDKVMDRLLCGDVGFGKTEVALRAAFKAVMDSKQVAIVAPTTILSEQHYTTCLKRFDGFGVRVAVLNRFVSSAKKQTVIEKIENGDVDVVVGTHSLFSEKIKFKDLGLLILDEEQRFGVEHKEKLKSIKKNVDTLTMTATPIPRTLHMSLSGIRDISTINTPPSRRIPVQTYVVEESEALIIDAVNKEIARKGQVFILYNRVDSIDVFESNLRKILSKEVRIVVAHGQMQERQLENNIKDFYAGNYDVLISTTIIENGIDLPTANTIIVIDADKLGLSTLYQLKGRVGRSDRMAHAYFTYKSNKVLSDDAYKRLEAIMEFSEMGSGYKIALRDLEIRGAGNVLGKEQHGDMDKIGYELYSKLLKEQMGEVTKDYETELDVKVSAYIPETYIGSSTVRMECYKQIAEVKSENDALKIMKMMHENYGEVPDPTQNLVSIALMKAEATKYEIIKLIVSKDYAEIQLKDINSLNNESLNKALSDNSDKCRLTFREVPVIVFDDIAMSGEDRIAEITDFLS